MARKQQAQQERLPPQEQPHEAEPPPLPELQRDRQLGPLANAARTVDFWARTLSIYAGYKACQAQALALRLLCGWSEERLRGEHWAAQHRRAGEQMYALSVDLRGFYLKVDGCMGRGGEWQRQCQRFGKAVEGGASGADEARARLTSTCPAPGSLGASANPSAAPACPRSCTPSCHPDGAVYRCARRLCAGTDLPQAVPAA